LAKMLRRRPDALLWFAAGGLSLVEKGLYAWLGRMVGVRTLLFVRAGDVMDRARNSVVYRTGAGFLLRGGERLLCQGRSWQTFFAEVYGLPAERCPVVPNWTASETYLAIGAARKYETDGPVRVLFLAWLDHAKGILELIEAARNLVGRPDTQLVHFDICGEGTASDEVRQLVARYGLDAHVTFHGWVKGSAKSGAFAAADIFALPSYHEGMPNSMIEAMAAGLPVVVTPVGCVPDAITDEGNGLTVPVRDAAALSIALARLVNSAELRERLGRAGHRTAAEEFAVEGAVDRLSRVMNDLGVGRT
ncbi:MAG: glycosyltransferase family 4 protein, partial [Gemmatimonadales bacterium]